MPTTIKLKNSVTTTNAPSSLAQGEVAINVTDKKVWVGNAATTPVQLLGTGADGSFTNLAYTGTLTGGTGVVNLGSGQVYKDASGNVGIGTSSPSQKLEVSGSIRLDGRGNGFAYRTPDWRIYNTSSGNALAFDDYVTERMRIDSSGNVGIGTSSPSYRLQVYNNINGTPFAWGNASRTGFLYQDASGVGITDAANTAFTNGMYIQSSSNANLFYTNGSERMRIDSSGNLLVGTTASFGSYTRLSAQAPDGLVAIGAYRATTSTGYDIQQFRSDVGGTNSIKYAVYANGTAGAVSDVNLKKNIESAREYLDDLQKVRVVKYNWITDQNNASKELGFIAQEVAEIFPAMVSETEDGTKILKKEIFIPMLIKAIQEQQAIITDLKARIETLESK